MLKRSALPLLLALILTTMALPLSAEVRIKIDCLGAGYGPIFDPHGTGLGLQIDADGDDFTPHIDACNASFGPIIDADGLK